VDGNAEQASVDYPPVTTEVRPGELIFINDGLIRLKAREIGGDAIVTDVLKGGVCQTTRESTSPSRTSMSRQLRKRTDMIYLPGCVRASTM
jgi:pyruvate kinase